MLLSIIVPVYNVENFLEDCIRSLFDQDMSLNDYEIICVDDCSTDLSKEILSQMQEEFLSLKVVCHKENERQGAARNTGLKLAKGEYVWFVDSDDYILKNTISLLCKEAKRHHLDILQFGYYSSYDFLSKHIDDKCYEIKSGVNYVVELGNRLSYYIPLMWRTIFKRDFLIRNKLFFEEFVQYEDTDFALRAYYYANRVMLCDVPAYVYRINPMSTTHKHDTPLKLFFQILLLNRTSIFVREVDDKNFKNLLKSYISKELSQLGRCIVRMNFFYRVKYFFIGISKNIDSLKSYTSNKNWLRIKFAINI